MNSWMADRDASSGIVTGCVVESKIACPGGDPGISFSELAGLEGNDCGELFESCRRDKAWGNR